MRILTNKNTLMVYILLGACIALGAMLRSYNIFDKSLWMDELFSAWASDPGNSLGTVFHRTVEDVHPPLFQILLWVAYKVFGYGEGVGRVFSMVLGVAIIPVMYILGFKLFNVKIGLFVAFLSAINFYLIVFSQNTRSYELLVFLTVVSFVLLLDLVRKQNYFSAICYALACAALVNTHYFGFLLVMNQAIFLMWFSFYPRFKKRLFFLGAGVGIFILASIVPIVPYILINMERKDTWIQVPVGRFAVESLVLPFGDLSAALLSLVLLLVGLNSLIKKDTERLSLLLLLSWWLISYAVAYVKSLFFTPVLSEKNIIVFVPVMLLFIACGVEQVKGCGARVVLLAFLALVSVFYFLKGADLPESVRIEHDLRSPAIKIINEGKNIPVYGRWDTFHATYFKLLGASIDVAGLDVIENSMAAGKPPVCFFMIADQWDRGRINNYQSKYSVELKDTAEFKNSAVLKYCVRGHSIEPP
ncbi:putative membrane protein [Pseudomonas koreensis]|uniref:glycosyltransferase family 39 protein n=1 Tax=Pseudomonas koreensis TaxID=198620 RepID=UPI002858A88F|nr:glycosyltransferase family 39 protein [Pseudomonas koreensis]MDR7054993.1 putative membrane protein [Pseudomonas koreensis]